MAEPHLAAQDARPDNISRVRTVTVFLCLPKDPDKWEQGLRAAGSFLAQAESALKAKGEGQLHGRR